MSYAKPREEAPWAGCRPPAKFRGRPSKFTLERIQQIRDLLARGETHEEIAAQIRGRPGARLKASPRSSQATASPSVRHERSLSGAAASTIAGNLPLQSFSLPA
jgi:hypothetical protein